MTKKEPQRKNERMLTLPISNAEVYSCTVLSYRIGHGKLKIQIDKGQAWRGRSTFYLIFMNVLYYEGPLTWRSADFRIGSESELEEVTEKLHFSRGYKVLSEEHSLFIVETTRGQVRILAHRNVNRYKEPFP